MTPRILRRAPSESTLHKKNMELRQDKLALQEQIRVLEKEAANRIDWLERKYDDLALEYQNQAESLQRKDKELEERDMLIERLLREKGQSKTFHSQRCLPNFRRCRQVRQGPFPAATDRENLDRYLFNVNDEKRVNPQLKIRVNSGYHLYLHAHREEGKAWEDIDKDEKFEWRMRCKQIARIQRAQVEAGLIYHSEVKN
ncbi:hypothetical protein L5515_015514 [Caenorhabditis briggsae]|uniref:Uncharacterized protein n=1 Tax=Caenorhabditis briggsae TaxID=6238 RepID=A0AAE9J885_CAEBR|nr:hypothetical protein L5515_015514 [Caenorhabditis briggsae]